MGVGTGRDAGVVDRLGGVPEDGGIVPAVKYLIETQGEILDCATCDHPEEFRLTCPAALGMIPKIPLWIREGWRTFFLCRRLGALPHTGGVLDQPAALMRLFDEIGRRIEAEEANP